MALFFIFMIVTTEKNLRQVCERVSLEEGKEIGKKLVSILEKTSNGAGLAAPQIGINKRVCVIKNYNGFVIFINPVIVHKSSPFVNYQEGCLSFFGKRVDTIRYNNLVVKDDLGGEQMFSNFSAVAVHHECDHLDGVLMFDRQKPKPYEKCFCESGKKFKFCCWPVLK